LCLIYAALIPFVLAIIYKLWNIQIGPVMASTLQKLTVTILLFAIAFAVAEKKEVKKK
jgi:hypothetical protein